MCGQHSAVVRWYIGLYLTGMGATATTWSFIVPNKKWAWASACLYRAFRPCWVSELGRLGRGGNICNELITESWNRLRSLVDSAACSSISLPSSCLSAQIPFPDKVSSKLWRRMPKTQTSRFLAFDVTTCSKPSQFFTTTSTCDNTMHRQVSWFSDFVCILYNLKITFPASTSTCYVNEMLEISCEFLDTA